MQVFDERICQLGEGPLWHPTRSELFWFDILGKRLLSTNTAWDFDEHVSAAGWIDDTTLLMASETALWQFDIATGARTRVVGLEADDPVTRSNDGRADPWGGFWIGTMGKNLEPKAGAIYRYYRGELRQLHSEITVSNAICFSPDGTRAYFCDTPKRQIMMQSLSEKDGWPDGDPEVFVDLRPNGLNPDGAVVDADGHLWNAQWGAGRISRYGPKGFVEMIPVPATQVTCPAFGGADLTTMFATSAADGVTAQGAGMTYSVNLGIQGQREHQVTL